MVVTWLSAPTANILETNLNTTQFYHHSYHVDVCGMFPKRQLNIMDYCSFGQYSIFSIESGTQ